MNGQDDSRQDDPLADALAAYDDLLASGRETPPDALHEAVDPALLPEWHRLAAFLSLVEKAWPRDASATAADQPEAVQDGETAGHFGRFRILRTLGQGGFGIVFLAWDPALRRQVALKVPQPEALITPEARKRFLREAQAAAGLDHPNIVPVHETARVGTVAYIASAYCSGPTLAAWLARQVGSVPVRDAAGLIATLARAVEHAHERGVLHRDLKPSNILLQAAEDDQPGGEQDRPLTDFQPRITDFSLAWLADGEGPKTLSGVPLGSPPYMAPEQAEGRLKAIGPPTDVYGLGCILYEMLAGHPPFAGESQVETLRKVIADDPPPPRRMRRDLPIALEAIVLKCLAKDPSRRYPTARDLADDIGRFLAGEPIRARPPGRRQKIARVARRHPAALIVLAISALFGVTLLMGGRWYAKRLEESRQLARQRDDEARRRELDLRRAHYVADLRQAPGCIRSYQTRYAHELLVHHRPKPGEEDLREFTWYHLWQRCHQERRTLPGPRDVVYSVEFSPRGDLLASAGKDGSVLVWETSNWQLVHQIEASSKEVNVAAFAPDGKTIATVDDEGQLKLWETATGRRLLECPAHNGDAVIARFSPDGETIFTGGRDDGLIKIWDRSSGRMLHAFRASEREVESAVLSPDGSILAIVGYQTIKLWSAADRTMIAAIPATEDDSGQGVAFSHDGTKLAVAYERDRVVRLWDVSSRRLLREFRGHTDGVFSLAFSSDDRTIVTGSDDQTIRRWDVATGAERGVWLGHTDRVWAVAFSPDGRTIATVSADGTAKLWDPEPLRDRIKLPILEPVCLAFSADGQTLTTIEARPRWSVDRWDVRSGTLLERTPLNLTGHKTAFSRDGRYLAVTNGESSITVCDLVTGQRQSLADPASRDVQSLEFSSDNRYLIVSPRQELWDLSNRRLISFPWEERVSGFFTPTGDLVAVLPNGSVGWWDPRTGRTRTAARKPNVNIDRIVSSHDGRLLASSGYYNAGRIDLWSADTLELRKEMPGHRENIVCLAFAPDGKTLASSGEDGMFKLWNVATNEELLTLEGYTGTVWVAAFSPDNKALATIANMGPDRPSELVLWRVGRDEMDQATIDSHRQGKPAW